MMDILTDPSPDELVRAAEATALAHIPLYAQLPGARLCQEPDVLGAVTDLGPSVNRVYRAAFAPDQAEESIGRVLREYRARGCLPMYWFVGPSTVPLDLGKYLQACGFSFSHRVPGMAASLDGLDEFRVGHPLFVVERATTSTQLAHWTCIDAEVDGMSDGLKQGFYELFERQASSPDSICELFLGVENGKPVAASRLICAGGVAGIYSVATLPEARGRGYGTAMTLAAARAGRERGYRFDALFARQAGYGLYRRLGFQECCHVDIYKSPA